MVSLRDAFPILLATAYSLYHFTSFIESGEQVHLMACKVFARSDAGRTGVAETARHCNLVEEVVILEGMN